MNQTFIGIAICFAFIASISNASESRYMALKKRFEATTTLATIEDLKGVQKCYRTSGTTIEPAWFRYDMKTIDEGLLFEKKTVLVYEDPSKMFESVINIFEVSLSPQNRVIHDGFWYENFQSSSSFERHEAKLNFRYDKSENFIYFYFYSETLYPDGVHYDEVDNYGYCVAK